MKHSVDANYRFIAASQEVNARIGQRQHALALFVTLIVSLLAAMVAMKSGTAGSNAPVEWLLLGLPVASLCLAFLNHKAECAITNLRRFMSALEQLDDSDSPIPAYNTQPQWSQEANRARRFHDYASAMLIAGGTAIILGAAYSMYPQRIIAAPVLIAACTAGTALALLVVLASPRWSFHPDPARSDKEEDSLQA